MRRFVVICLLLFLSLGSYAQGRWVVPFISKDSLAFSFSKYNWRFHAGDDSAMARPDYDDRAWELTGSGLWNKRFESKMMDSVCWLRLPFRADSSIKGRPLVLRMTQFGASEVYLDGKLVKKFGIIDGDSSYYYDPNNIPFVVQLSAADTHVLAVRYKRDNTVAISHTFNDMNGFMMTLTEANSAILSVRENAESSGFAFALMIGLFFAFSLMHLLLYLYYRASRSNLWFSIFSFSLAVAFLLFDMVKVADSPALDVYSRFALVINTSLLCFSLSGFVRELFGMRRWHFRAIVLLCIIMPPLIFIDLGVGVSVCFGLLGVVSIEAIIIIIIAIIKKRKGARIIGTGLLLFAIFILFIFSYTILNGGLELDEATVFGQVVELFLVVAILSIPVSMSAYLAWSFSSINKDLKLQLDNVQELSAQTLRQEQERKRILETQKEELEKEVLQRTKEVVAQKEEIEKQHEAVKAEKKKSDDLLLNILPEEVAEELKQKGTSEARYFDKVSVLFTDFVNFTKAGERMSPQELVNELHSCFKAFDDIISKYGIEKIKTIGDAYLAVAGLPITDEQHAVHMAKAAVEIKEYMAKRRLQLGDKTFEIRIGIHSGSVVAGIVGVKKFAYDIWGDTVNTAARMEQHGEAGKINISQSTYEFIQDKFACSYRGQVSAKNKGELKMYFVDHEITAG